MSALTTLLALTDQPDWRHRYESITLYQMGWRLGGKGASGRNRDGRIEEHGLHVWMGWYQNAFKLIRSVYQELGRTPDVPLSQWGDAFKKHNFICFGEQFERNWSTWPVCFPVDEDQPGEGSEFPTLWDYIHLTLEGLLELLKGSFMPTPPVDTSQGLSSVLNQLNAAFERFLTLGREIPQLLLLLNSLRLASCTAKQLRDNPASHRPSHSDRLHRALNQARQSLRKHLERDREHRAEVRRLFIIFDTALTCVVGVLAEVQHFSAHALDKLDSCDFREFLSKHGADPETVNSALIRGFYDLLFAYRNGDPAQQSVSTGVAIRFIFRMVLTYDGAIFWKMQAGMGDTVFAPIHDVLKKRGVEFRFFHRLRNLELAPDGRTVARIELGRQATLKTGDYDPFVMVNSLPCWPSEPLYEQLEEGNEMQLARVNLESLWTPWKERETSVSLINGTDFDVIVLGVSLASLPVVAPQLVAASKRWQSTLAHVETVRTQALQLWLKPDLPDLGWMLPSAVSDAYAEPLDTWADMSHLIPREAWRSTAPPGSITYFCAPMIGGIPPESDSTAPARAQEDVKKVAIEWLNTNAATIWPRAVNATGFDWSILVDPDERAGVARFEAQYWKANIDPSERYVLSVPGSSAYRLHADQQDFDNLYVTGDWIYTGVNAGCVEGAVMAGLLTATAMTGFPGKAAIIGYQNP